MAVYKRYKGRRLPDSSDRDWKRGSWWAEGSVGGVRYHQSLAREGVVSRKEAEQAEAMIVAEIRGGTFDRARDRTTFRRYAETDYTEIMKAKNVTWETRVKVMVRMIEFFGETPLKAITAGQCEKYKAWRLTHRALCPKHLARCEECPTRPVSPGTVNRELNILSDLFSCAVRDRKMPENPMRHVGRLAEPPPREKLLTPEQQNRLIEEAEKTASLWPVVMTALLTGWRKGQILGIRAEDLDASTQSVWIGRSKNQPPRKVPVNSLAWEILSRLAGFYKTGYLFRSTKTGERLKWFNRSWQILREKAGLPGLRFHDLRGVFATAMIEARADSFTIQRALGHSSDSMTKRYAQVTDPLLLDGLKRVEAAVRETMPAGEKVTGKK